MDDIASSMSCDGDDNNLPGVATYNVVAYPSSELPKEYEPMVFARWLRSFRYGNRAMRNIHSGSFFKAYHGHVEELLAKPDSVVRLAVLSDDQDVVLGFSVCRESVLDYVHVQKDHRNQGIAKSLVPKSIKFITHMTNIAQPIFMKYLGMEEYRHINFNPRV